jgi:hypothetical protein
MDDMNQGNQPNHDSYRSCGPSDVTQPVPAMTGPLPPARHRHKALRWTAGLAAAAVLAGGGAVAGIDLAGSGSPAGGQAAVLSAALNGASSAAPGTSALSGATLSGAPSSGATSSGATSSGATSSGDASSGYAAGARAGRAAVALRRLRGLHGEFTVRNGTGGFREIAFERGAITAVSSKTVTVRAADGTTWTWTLMSNTVVRKDRARSSAANLAAGDPVFVGGPEQGQVRGARLIIVPEKRAAGQSGSPQGSAPGPSPSSG